MNNKKPRLSKSRISTYHQCPHRYYVMNIENYKPKTLSPFLIKGSLIHDAFDNYYKLGSIDLKDYKNHEKNFMDFNKYCGVAPLMHEDKFVDEERNYAGILDRLQTLPNGKTLLLDYKTGKVHPVKNYKFELDAYAHLITQAGNPMPDYVGIFFTEHNLIDYIACSQKGIDTAKEHIDQVSKELTTKLKMGREAFFKKKGILCNYCDLWNDGLCEGIKKKKKN